MTWTEIIFGLSRAHAAGYFLLGFGLGLLSLAVLALMLGRPKKKKN
ncbi:hypothetical protein ES707_18433 [subsurface metagenome]